MTKKRSRQLEYYYAHREERKAYQREYQRRKREKDPAQLLIDSALARARRRKLPFSIDRHWVTERLRNGACELTAIPFDADFVVGRSAPFAPSIDRRDVTKGYTRDNCRLVIWALNSAINDFGEDVYRRVAEAYLDRNTAAPESPRHPVPSGQVTKSMEDPPS